MQNVPKSAILQSLLIPGDHLEVPARQQLILERPPADLSGTQGRPLAASSVVVAAAHRECPACALVATLVVLVSVSPMLLSNRINDSSRQCSK